MDKFSEKTKSLPDLFPIICILHTLTVFCTENCNKSSFLAELSEPSKRCGRFAIYAVLYDFLGFSDGKACVVVFWQSGFDKDLTFLLLVKFK